MIEQRDVTTAEGVADVWWAEPREKTARPPVLFLMDVFGPRARLFEMAETYAGRGYQVALPNLFYRTGRASYADPFAAMHAHSPEMYVRDGAKYLDALGGARALVVGYCLGGAVALRLAAAYPDRVAGVAIFHAGGLATDAPSSPHRLAPRLRCPLRFAHADHDAAMSPAKQELLSRALSEAGVDFHAEMYPGCRHGFTMSDREVYDEAGCARHWREVFTFFERFS